MRRVLALLRELDTVRGEMGFKQDLLTPGFLKELIIGHCLGHAVHTTKHGPDAQSADGTELYEYLCAKEGGTFQIDRIDLSNLHRIERNAAFFFARFSKDNSLRLLEIYRVPTAAVRRSAVCKIEESAMRARRRGEYATARHIGFSWKWITRQGVCVWREGG